MKAVRSLLATAGAFAVVFVSSGVFAQQLFDSWVTYRVAKKPACVFSADLDADGDLDLVVSHTQVDITQRNPVIILKNNGAGLFTRDTTLHTRGNPVQVLARDLDGDGDLDIVTVNNSTSKVSIFKNRGGGLGYELPLDCNVGTSPLSIEVDSIDGDSVPDILTSNAATGTASLLINHGAAAFPAESTKFLGLNPRSIVVFDYDNDGDKDFAAALRVVISQTPGVPPQGINGVVVMENEGGGRFDDSTRVFFKIPLASDTTKVDALYNPTKVIAADFNGDGYFDLALADSAVATDTARSKVSIFMNVPSRGGVYRSTDNGAGWSGVNAGLTNAEIRALAVHSGGAIFAGTGGGGVYRSTDNGLGWTAVNTGLTNTSIRVLAPNSGGHIFAGTFGGGVFRSTDNGAGWTAVNNGLTNSRISSLAFNSSGHIFAGTSSGGVFRSLDNGAGWTAVNNGLTNSNVLSLALNSSGHIFAGTNDSGVFRSTNNGAGWTKVNAGLTNTRILFLALNSSGHIFAGTAGGGVFRSTDNGAGWTAVNAGLTNTEVRSLALNSSGHIFAGTFGGGVFRSTDNGAGWTAVNTGLANTKVLALTLNSGGDIFTGTNGGLNASNFARPLHYPVGLGCRSIFAADLDGDGDLDIAAISPTNGSVTILKNSGNGTFPARANYLTPAQPYWVDGGDYDRDGDIDLAVPGFAGATVAVLRNRGNGSFEVGTEFSTGGSALSHGIACGNIDTDGDNDLAVGSFTRDQVSIHKNNGSIVFPSPPLNSDFYFAGNPRVPVLVDLDLDGDLDIATANQAFGLPPSDGSVSVFKNNGNGSFAAAVFYNLAPGSFPHSIVSRDFDADGDSDLVTADFGRDKVTILKNNGNATFADTASFFAGEFPHSITAADFDRDGDMDVAVGNLGDGGEIDSIAVLFNDGTGAFPTRVIYVTGSSPTSLVGADFNADGWPDLAVCHAGNIERDETSVKVLLNNRTGGFGPAANYTPGEGPAAIIAADMDRDGDLDLVTANSASNAISFFANDGDGNFAVSADFGAGLDPRGLAACDLDGDGDLELAVTNIQMVNSPPGFSPHGGFTVLKNLSESFCFARGDLNGDMVINLTDAILEQNCVFLSSGSCPFCTADSNCDGSLSPVDVILLMRKVFNGTPLPC